MSGARRSVSKQSAVKNAPVKKVPGSSVKAVEQWIADIWQLHSGRPAPTVNYAAPMPDMDTLLQEWPPEMEALLGEKETTTFILFSDIFDLTDFYCAEEMSLPSADSGIQLEDFVDVTCNILDIPVYK